MKYLAMDISQAIFNHLSSTFTQCLFKWECGRTVRYLHINKWDEDSELNDELCVCIIRWIVNSEHITVIYPGHSQLYHEGFVATHHRYRNQQSMKCVCLIIIAYR